MAVKCGYTLTEIFAMCTLHIIFQIKSILTFPTWNASNLLSKLNYDLSHVKTNKKIQDIFPTFNMLYWISVKAKLSYYSLFLFVIVIY
jgi:hypothetical protein